jgi:hypothetical protein
VAGAIDRVVIEAYRGLLALGCGVVAYLASSSLGPVAGLPSALTTVVSLLLFVLAGMAGYGLGRALIHRAPAPRASAAEELPPPAPRGWEQAERRLTTWFAERLAHPPASLAEECSGLARRLGIEQELP